MGGTPLGLSFGSVAETYERVRPPYPQQLLDRARDMLELTPERACSIWLPGRVG